MRQGFPITAPGLCVGLFGGSFDPAHDGHVHVSREALKRFGLDAVWWLVSPGNPLKRRQPAPLGERIRTARALLSDPRITVTGLEAETLDLVLGKIEVDGHGEEVAVGETVVLADAGFCQRWFLVQCSILR